MIKRFASLLLVGVVLVLAGTAAGCSIGVAREEATPTPVPTAVDTSLPADSVVERAGRGGSVCVVR